MTFTLLVVVSTSQPGVYVMTIYRALIRSSGEDAMGRSCILEWPEANGCSQLFSHRLYANLPPPSGRRFHSGTKCNLRKEIY